MTNWTIEKTERLLREVRDDLISGKISEEQFDIGDTVTITECGTVACIGGWCLIKDYIEQTGHWPRMWKLMPISNIAQEIRIISKNRGNGLEQLFFEWRPSNPSITQVTEAIDRWLAGDNYPWGQK